MTTSLGDFAIAIMSDMGAARIVEQADYTYVPLKHGSEYKVKMWNRSSSKCDAKMIIDGEVVGKWRIDANSSIKIERPVDVERKFTFYREGSTESAQAGITTGGEENGLVQVEFTPEKWVAPVNLSYSNFSRGGSRFESGSRDEFDGGYAGGRAITRGIHSFPTSTNSTFSSGGTGLGAKSNQSFGQARPITYDMSRAKTISVRLVVDESDAEPAIVPLGQRATAVPPRIRSPF